MNAVRAGLTGAAVVAVLTGCQSYKPQPLDIDAHRALWEARTPHDEGIGAFVERLAMEDASAALFDVEDGVSLREAEAVALLFNPNLRLARLRAGVAIASAEHAGRWEDPVFSIDIEKIIESVPEPWVLGASLGLTLPISGRLGVERAVAEAEHRALMRSVEAEEWAVRIALREAWLEWSADRARANLLRELLERLDDVVDIAQRLEQAGEISRSEARLLRIERAARAGALRSLEARLRERELALKALMGLAPHAPVQLAPAILAGLEPERTSHADVVRRNPLLLALQAEHETSEEALRLEMRKQYPDLTIGPGLGTEDGDTRFLLGLSLPLPVWNRNQQSIAEAAARRELARGTYEVEYERLMSRLASAEAQYESARAERSFIEEQVAPLVEEQDAEARRVAALGEVETLILLENFARLHDTKAALIDAYLAEALAITRLQEVTGPPALRPEVSEGRAP